MPVELERICIPPSMSIKHAVEVLNNGHQRIVLILSDSRRLLGVIADSDIRKAILNRLSFDLPVSEIMVKQPVVASAGMSDGMILSLMRRTKCYEIPLLDNEKKVVGLKTIDSLISHEQSAEVVIMAGGLGMRLMPITEATPKPLIPLGRKPVLFFLLDQLILSGFRRITVALNYEAEMIRKAISEIPEYTNCVRFIQEKNRLGTAGALSLLQNPPTAPFFVLNADLLTKVDFLAMLRFHEVEGNQVTVAVREEKYQVPFGVIKLRGMQVADIEEKPVHSYFASAGIYLLDPSIRGFVPANCFCDMPDVIKVAVANGKRVGVFPVHEYWMDIGTRSDLEQAKADAVSVFADNSFEGRTQ